MIIFSSLLIFIYGYNFNSNGMSKVLLEKLIVTRLVKKFPPFMVPYPKPDEYFI